MSEAALPECYRCHFSDAGYPCWRADGGELDDEAASKLLGESVTRAAQALKIIA